MTTTQKDVGTANHWLGWLAAGDGESARGSCCRRPVTAMAAEVMKRCQDWHISKYAVLVLGILTVSACGKFRTDYANANVKKQWHLVAVGDSIQSVYKKVGVPLFIEVNSDRAGDGAYRTVRDTNVEASHLEALSSNTNVALHLFYSWPARNASGHFRYQADVVWGVVVGKSNGELVD